MERYLIWMVLSWASMAFQSSAQSSSEKGADAILKPFSNQALIKDASRLVRVAIAKSKGKELILPAVDSNERQPVPPETRRRVYIYRIPLATPLSEQPLSFTEFGKRVLVGYINAELRVVLERPDDGDFRYEELRRRLSTKPEFRLDRNDATGWATGADIAAEIYEELAK